MYPKNVVIRSGFDAFQAAEELASMKRISIQELAESYGWNPDCKRSSRNNPVLIGPANDRIGCSMKNGVGLFHDFRTGQGGTSIDFVQQYVEPGCSIGRVRQILRAYLGSSTPVVSRCSRGYRLDEQSESVGSAPNKAIGDTWAKLSPLTFDGQNYLIGRGLPVNVIRRASEAGCVKSNNQRVCFVHRDSDERVTGWEAKNCWPPMPKGGLRSLWVWQTNESVNKIVIAESAIDAMSYYALHGGDIICSIGGTPCKRGCDVIESLVSSNECSVVLAMDSDEPGKIFAERIGAILDRLECPWTYEAPASHKDWNEELQSRGVSS